MNRDGCPGLPVRIDAADPFNNQVFEIRVDCRRASRTGAGLQRFNTAFIPPPYPLSQGIGVDLQQLADVLDAFPEQAVTNRLQPDHLAGIVRGSDRDLNGSRIPKTRVGAKGTWHDLKILSKNSPSESITTDF